MSVVVKVGIVARLWCVCVDADDEARKVEDQGQTEADIYSPGDRADGSHVSVEEVEIELPRHGCETNNLLDV